MGQPVNVPPLNEAMAIELGGNLLGEGILFVVAAAVLIVEYRRQSAKQAAKEEEQEEIINGLQMEIRDLSMEVETQRTQIRQLFRHIYDIDSRVVKIPWTSGQKLEENEEITSVGENFENKNSSLITSAVALVTDILGFKERKVTTKR